MLSRGTGEAVSDPPVERGAILPMMAMFLVVLMGLAAMAIDLGWLFWNSVEIQHGADAAALAGVVYEPDLRLEAHAEASASASENGYDDGAAGTTVSVVDFVDDPGAVVNESMLRVTVTHSVSTFFLTLFGFESFDISRTAVAEYVQPLALGSPESYFGDDPARGLSPGFWGQINGTYVAKWGGDRFASHCLHRENGSGCTANPEARPVSGWGTPNAQGGYLYGIEVEDSAAGLTVEIFDGPLYALPKWDDKNTPAPPLDTWGNFITGNFAGDTKKNPGWTVNARTWFMLYGPDLTPLDTTDGNELLCSVYYDERVNTSDATNPPVSDAYLGDYDSLGWDVGWLEFDQVSQPILDAMWDSMASPTIGVSSGCEGSFDRGKGIYVLRVFNEHDPVGNWRGANKYSLRVSSAAAIQPAIYGIGAMVISATRNTQETAFHLARVEERYKGKDLIIELWDVGDIEGGVNNTSDTNAIFRIVDGTGATVSCEWTATDTSPIHPDGKTPSNPTAGGPGPCSINASNRRFNDELITITTKIPDNYTCTGDGCWWSIIYTIAGQVKETTTWAVFVDGNPLRIVE
jgi:hypothetical protein